MYSEKLLSDFAPVMELLYYTFKIFGILPMTLRSQVFKNRQWRYSFKPSKWGMIYNVTLIITAVTAAYISLTDIPETDYEGRKHFDDIVDITQCSCATFTCSIILITFSVQQEKVILIINKLNVARELANIVMKPCNERKHLLTKNLLMIFFTHTFTWLLMIVTASAKSFTGLMYDVAVCISYFVISSMLLQYSVGLIFFKNLFGIVNDELRLEYPGEYFSTNDHIRCLQHNYLQVEIDKVLHLRKMYSSISNISQDLCDFYSHSMLFCTLHIFLTLIFASYYFTKPIFLGHKNLPFYLAVHCVVHTIVNGAPLIILTKCVTDTIKEVILFKLIYACVLKKKLNFNYYNRAREQERLSVIV